MADEIEDFKREARQMIVRMTNEAQYFSHDVKCYCLRFEQMCLRHLEKVLAANKKKQEEEEEEEEEDDHKRLQLKVERTLAEKEDDYDM